MQALRTVVLILLAASAGIGQSLIETETRPHISKTLAWSQVVLIGSTTFDLASSRGLQEQNPLLGRGDFGGRQAAIGAGMTAGVLVFERWAVKRWPKAQKVFTIVNFGVSAGHVGAGVRNGRIGQ